MAISPRAWIPKECFDFSHPAICDVRDAMKKGALGAENIPEGR